MEASSHAVSFHTERPMWQGFEGSLWPTASEKQVLIRIDGEKLNLSNDHMSELGNGSSNCRALI